MKIYKITEASEYLGVSINTLKTLANNGKIKSFKTTGEHRRFRQEDLDAYMGVEKEKQEKLTVIYARCSTAKQKENLERQKDRLRKHAEAKGYKYVLIDEIASGINEKRNGIHKLIKMCFEGKVERILIEYKDRLARFGYEYLDAIFKNLEITVEVVETKETVFLLRESGRPKVDFYPHTGRWKVGNKMHRGGAMAFHKWYQGRLQ